jgi:hypothetical protein
LRTVHGSRVSSGFSSSREATILAVSVLKGGDAKRRVVAGRGSVGLEQAQLRLEDV